MADTDRVPAKNVTLFTLGGTSFVDSLENCTVKFNVKHEDGSGIADDYVSPVATKGDWDIDGELFYTGSSGLMNSVGSVLTVAFESGGSSYSGNALVSTGTHTAHRDGLQKVKVMLMGRGAPSLS